MNIEREIIDKLRSKGNRCELVNGIYTVLTTDGQIWDFTQPQKKELPTAREELISLRQSIHSAGGCGAEPRTWSRGWDDNTNFVIGLIDRALDRLPDNI